MKKYKVIGLMSGSSLDGLDIAYCEFVKNKNWKYEIIVAETINYNPVWRKKLSFAHKRSKSEISDLDIAFGKLSGLKVKFFIKKYALKPDFISSHGHTIFHQPEKKFTLQIGNGKTIASVCGLPVICDFRSGDVKLGGQGAPLVPIADKILFSNYKFCLNLGGIANISFDDDSNHRIAFDICPVNIILNTLANQLEKQFDKDGKIARSGKIQLPLLQQLNSLCFYQLSPPKSLGREWIEKEYFPILNFSDIPVRDKLRTVCEHIAIQISLVINAIPKHSNSKLLITGGGAYNKFLLQRISELVDCKIVLPDDKTIQFKEAMAFAFLGVLKTRKETNILKSVTGAKKDSSGGKIFVPG